MSLDEQLRAVLNQEAELRTASRPDVQSLIAGGQALRRRRTVARFGAGLAAAVVLVGAGYGVAQLGDGGSTDGVPTKEPTESTDLRVGYAEGLQLRPGTTYLVRAGTDENGEAIDAEVQFDGPGWGTGNHPWVYDGRNSAGVAFYVPIEVPTGDDCVDPRMRLAASNMERLVGQLSRLPGSTVTKTATPVDAFGHVDGRHLRVRVDTACAPDGYLVASTPAGSHGISYEHPGTSSDVVIVDFWVFDLDGTATVVERWTQVGGSPELAEQVSRTIDSVTLLKE